MKVVSRFAFSVAFSASFVGFANAQSLSASGGIGSTGTAPVSPTTIVAQTQQTVLAKTPAEVNDYVAKSQQDWTELENRLLINFNTTDSFVDDCYKYFCPDVVAGMDSVKKLKKSCEERPWAISEAICWGTYHTLIAMYYRQCYGICQDIDSGKNKVPRGDVQKYIDEHRPKVLSQY